MDPAHGQVFDHVLLALHEPRLVHRGARVVVGPNVAEELIDLGDELCRRHVHARPLLRDLVVALQRREEARKYGQDQEGDLQEAELVGHGEGDLDLLIQDRSRDVVHDLLHLGLLQAKEHHGDRQGGAEDHHKGDARQQGQGAVPELRGPPRHLPVLPPGLHHERPVDGRGADLPRAAVVAVHDGHELRHDAVRRAVQRVHHAHGVLEGLWPPLHKVHEAVDVAERELLGLLHAGVVKLLLQVVHDLARQHGLQQLRAGGVVAELGRLGEEGPAVDDGRALPDLLHILDDESHLLRHIRRIVQQDHGAPVAHRLQQLFLHLRLAPADEDVAHGCKHLRAEGDGVAVEPLLGHKLPVRVRRWPALVGVLAVEEEVEVRVGPGPLDDRVPHSRLVLQGLEGPVLKALPAELLVRRVLGRVPEVALQGHGRGPLHDVGAHGLRAIEEALHEAPGHLRLHVGLVLHVRRHHSEDLRLPGLEALLEENLEVGEVGPCEGPDVGPAGCGRDAAYGGGHLLLQHVVRHFDQLLVRELRVVHLQLVGVPVGSGLAAATARLRVFPARHAQAALGVAHELAQPPALAELRRGHLGRVAQGAHALEEHAGHLLVDRAADLLQHRRRQLQVVGDEDSVLHPREAGNRKLGIPQVGVLRARLRGLRIDGALLILELPREELPEAVVAQEGGLLVLRQGRQWDCGGTGRCRRVLWRGLLALRRDLLASLRRGGLRRRRGGGRGRLLRGALEDPHGPAGAGGWPGQLPGRAARAWRARGSA
mmetsp:Transcript_10519/g.32708  ORF Transcript_10519/g.32708 Transcript_10519/m.32708 type:complete len:767 (+) Transcript_10519:965-3265(+)